MRLPVLCLLLLAISFSSCKKEVEEPNDDQQQVNDPPPPTSTVNLQASIGLSAQPQSGDSICDITLYLASDYDSNAVQVGEQVYDFTLYNRFGTEFKLKEILEGGKPVVLMSGSYTCPVFRNNVSKLNQLIDSFGVEVNFYIVYVVEPHPDVDISPYSGTVWTTNQNVNQGILYRQPVTYGDRLQIISDMQSQMTFQCEVLVDGPCNEYWLNFGEAPNRAYFLDPTGKVEVMHGWFDFPTMYNSIDAYLNQ